MWLPFLALLPLIAAQQEEIVENADNFRKRVRTFNEDNSVTSGQSNSDKFASMARLFSEYGGMLGAGSAPTTAPPPTTKSPQSGFQSLLSSFLGSSSAGDGDVESLPPPPTPRPRARPNNFLNLFGGNSNVQKPSESGSGAGNLFGSFFGLMPTTTTTTTEAPPVQRILSMFVPQQETTKSPTQLGPLNFLQLFGVTPRTPTTTQAPFQSLFNPSKPYSGGPEDIDGIVNALMRSNARPASQEPASLLSQFFGGK